MRFTLEKIELEEVLSLDASERHRLWEWKSDPTSCHLTNVNQSESPLSFDHQPPAPGNIDTNAFKQYWIKHGDAYVGEVNFEINAEPCLGEASSTAWLGLCIGDSKFRGRGVGFCAMNLLLQEIRRQNIPRCELGVFEFNAPAIALYEKLGFMRFADIPDFTWWNGKWWKDYRYELVF